MSDLTNKEFNSAGVTKNRSIKEFSKHFKKKPSTIHKNIFIEHEKAAIKNKINIKEADLKKKINIKEADLKKKINIKEQHAKTATKLLGQKIKTHAETTLDVPIQKSKIAAKKIIIANAKINSAKDYTGDTYKRYLVKQTRPDVVLIGEIFLVGLFIAAACNIIPKISSAKGPKYSLEMLLKASKLPIGQLTVAETNDTQTELLATETFKKYFEFDPFSDENSGKDVVNFVNLMWPLITLIIRVVIPPLLLGYIIWFVVVYWTYVYAAIKGWFKMMIEYGSDMMQGKFGCKWYIKMATGWGCNDVNYADYYDPWKVKYIDIPIYYERMKYIRKFLWVKRAYYEVPYRKYIIRPKHIYKTKYRFAKMLYTTRAFDVLLKTMLGVDRALVQMPRDRLLDLLKGKEYLMPALFAKVKQAKSQINNKKYPSINSKGKPCMCPASHGPLSKLKKIQGDAVQMADKVNKIYSKYTTKLHDETKQIQSESAAIKAKASELKAKAAEVKNAANDIDNLEGFGNLFCINNNNNNNIIAIIILAVFAFSIIFGLFIMYNNYNITLAKGLKYYYIGVILLVLFILL